MSLNFEIKTLPHRAQRYKTVGDYWKEGAVDCFRISSMGNRVYEFLVSIHEQVESFLCEQRGIPEPIVKEFDERFERSSVMQQEAEEPGDHPHAPYRREHRFAENIERMIAAELGVDWSEYEKTVDALYCGDCVTVDYESHRWADDGGNCHNHGL